MFSDIISVISERDKYLASLIESIDKMLLVDSFTVILKSRAIGERVVKNIILIEGITGTDEMKVSHRRDRAHDGRDGLQGSDDDQAR